MKTHTQWIAQDETNAIYLGILEFQANDGEWHDQQVYLSGDGDKVSAEYAQANKVN